MNLFDFGLRYLAGGAKQDVFKVAVVGIGCRLPGNVHNPDRSSTLPTIIGFKKELPSYRGNISDFLSPPESVGEGYVSSGDPTLFDISPREGRPRGASARRT
jgi:hypothetical protein